jgi:CRP/FNR family transcriptional regulator
LIEIKAGARPLSEPVARKSLGGQTVSTTSGSKTSEHSGSAAGVPCSACKSIGVPCALESHATSLRTRRGQTLALAPDGGETAFIVREGLFTLQIALPDNARQVTAIFFPGDLLRSGYAPPRTEAAFVAASPGEVLRLRVSALEALAATEPAVRRYVDSAIASRMGRQAIQAVMLGQFDCEQKLATFFLELALRAGLRATSGGALDMPFDRKEIAAYLGLNPDTLSRIMSRFKTAGLIGPAERGRIVVRDLAALAARSPAAASLIELSEAKRLDSAQPMAGRPAGA